MVVLINHSMMISHVEHSPPSCTTTRAPDDGKGRFTFVSETQQLAGDDGREGCASTGGAGWCTSRIKVLVSGQVPC